MPVLSNVGEFLSVRKTKCPNVSDLSFLLYLFHPVSPHYTWLVDDNLALGGTSPVLGDGSSTLGNTCPVLGDVCPILGDTIPPLGNTISPLGVDSIVAPLVGGSIALALSGELILHLAALEDIIPS